MKKNNFLMASTFLIAIVAAFAFNTPLVTPGNVKNTQQVFYNTGMETNCPNTATCSNVDNGTLCVTGISTYYNSQATPSCTATSAFKWLIE